jgi:hypothetical protein
MKQTQFFVQRFLSVVGAVLLASQLCNANQLLPNSATPNHPLVTFDFYSGAGLLFSLTNSGWGSSGIQAMSPAALVISFGTCPLNAFRSHCLPGSALQYLDPIAFLPSNAAQTTTITGGLSFSNVSSVIETGNFWFSVPRALSNTGSVPAGFPQTGSSASGPYSTGQPNVAVTSINVTIGAFAFFPKDSNHGDFWWVAADPVNPITPESAVPEVTSFALLTLGIAGLGLWLRKGIA